jgi:hypothetical protein
MKDKILTALKNKYRNLGLSDKAFEGMADYLAITTTEEGQVETAISGVEPILKGLQGDIDKRVTDAVAKAKADAAKQDPTPPAPKPEDPKPKDDVPAWAQALIDNNKSLAEKLSSFESGKTTETRKSIIAKKLEDLPEKFKTKFLKDFARMSFEKDEDFDAYMEETATDIEDIKQEISDSGLNQFGKPGAGSGGASKKEASKEEVDGIVNGIM